MIDAGANRINIQLEMEAERQEIAELLATEIKHQKIKNSDISVGFARAKPTEHLQQQKRKNHHKKELMHFCSGMINIPPMGSLLKLMYLL